MEIGKGWFFLAALILSMILCFFILKIPAIKNIGPSYKRTAETRKGAIAIFIVMTATIILYTGILVGFKQFGGDIMTLTTFSYESTHNQYFYYTNPQNKEKITLNGKDIVINHSGVDKILVPTYTTTGKDRKKYAPIELKEGAFTEIDNYTHIYTPNDLGYNLYSNSEMIWLLIDATEYYANKEYYETIKLISLDL